MNFLKKLRLGQKISIGFGSITMLLIFVLLFGFYGMKNNSKLFSEMEIYMKKTEITGRIQANFLNCRIAFKSFILEKDTSQLEIFKERYNKALTFINDYKQLENDSNNLFVINNTEDLIKQYNIEFNKILSYKSDILRGKSNDAVKESIKKMDEIGPKVADNIENLKLKFIKDEEAIDERFKNNLNYIMALMLILSIVGGIFGIIVSIAFTKFILSPVSTLSRTFKKISAGDTDMSVRLNVTTSDEIGKMSNYFNLFMEKLEAIFNDIKKQNKVKTSQSEIDEITRGEQSLDEISIKIINYVCNLTNAYIGAIYIKEEEDNFYFKGGYAQNYDTSKFTSKINIKNGIFGQAIIEKSIKFIDNLPNDYFKINSALGNAIPKNLIVIPCFTSDEAVCVIEIGSFNDFSKEDIELLDSISNVIAIGINTTISREKINDLYQKTLQQTEELTVQQEELMQSHEELMEQTNALIEKENQLIVQQEELRVTNTELEDKNNELESQRQEVNKKNKDLEAARDELLEKTKALELSSKYKSEFLANVSHELKTPLNSILVLSELLMSKTDNLPLNQKEMEYASTINNSGLELLTLISDILDLAKVEAGKIDINKENVSLKDLAQYFKNTFNEVAKSKGLKFEILLDNNLEYIYTDELRLKQIIKNLLSNAFKFTSSGTVIFKIARSIKNDKAEISFMVSDTGIGIEKSKLSVVFEAFKQADGTINRKYGGTGLGLSISKQLSHLLGGDITAESEIEKGSTFTLVLPENEGEIITINSEIRPNIQNINTDKIEINATEKEINNKISSILIIEDDEIFRNVLSEYATQKGLEVYIAFDGKSGIEKAKENLPDAIILDIGLPDMSGVEVLNQLEANEKTKNIPVHIISGYDKNEIINQKSVFSYLKKPVTKKQIQKVFNELESLTVRPFKKVLIVGISDNELENSLNHKNEIVIKNAVSGNEANSILDKEGFDCIILDKQLSDMTATEFLANLSEKGKINIPIIIYTDKEITIEEEEELLKYSDSIIIRGAKSLDRLIAEADIFLYKLNEDSFMRKKSGKTNKLIEEDKLSGKKVLIVDDDVRNIFSITGILENKGINVVVARNGKDGIEKFINNPDIDLILMDIMMPVIDGYETIREIRKTFNGKNVPIIAITAKSMADDRTKCIEAGADDYTTKPIDVEKLISLLRVWLFK